MLITRLVLTNVCKHEILDWRLQPGVVGILGTNGAGKSTAINAGYAALTNDYSRFEGGKRGLIRQQAADNATSSIELYFEHRGDSYYVKRGLRPDSHLFRQTNGDGPDLTRAADIAKAIEEQVGVSRALLDNYVFVGQWDIFAFLDLTDTARAKHFAKLCGTTAAETRWEALGKQIDLDQRLAAQVVDSVDDIRSELRTATDRRDGFQKTVDELTEQRLSAARIEKLRKILARRERFVEASNSMVTARQQEEERLAAAKTAVRAAKSKDKELADARTLLETVQEDVEAAREQTAMLRARLERVEERQEIEDELADKQAEIRKKPTLPEEIADDTEQSLFDAWSDAKALLNESNELLDAFSDDESDPACPTCGTRLSDSSELESKVIVAREALAEQEGALREAKSRLDAFRAHHRDIADYRVWEEAKRTKVAQLQERIAKLPEGDAESIESVIATNNAIVQDRNAKLAVVQGLEDEIAALRQRKERAVSRHQAMKAELAKLEETVTKSRVSKQKAEEAEEELTKDRQVLQSLAKAEARVDEIARTHRELKRRLRRIKAAVDRSKKGEQWVTFLKAARAVLHRDALPATVHRAVLAEMERGINEDLDSFGATFHIESTDELGFTAFFRDGTVMPATGLSGGEKVTLGLPFRLQVNSMFASQVGMLVLDEPTAGLDAEHVESVVEMFTQLRGRAKAAGFQVLVVTHESGLERAFDQSFVVGNGE